MVAEDTRGAGVHVPINNQPAHRCAIRTGEMIADASAAAAECMIANCHLIYTLPTGIDLFKGAFWQYIVYFAQSAAKTKYKTQKIDTQTKEKTYENIKTLGNIQNNTLNIHKASLKL